MQIRLEERVALVTGGSRGIGRAIAQSLASTGATVVVNFRGNQVAADETVASIEAAGGKAVAIQADVANAEDVDRLFKDVLERFGRIDILVNNAGITRDTLMLRMKDEDWDAVMDTNLRGLFLCTRAALRPMTRARWGRIINITSVVGLMGNAGQANYAAAKAGIIGFSKSVAREIGSRSITVNAVAPGFIDTELTAVLSADMREALVKQIPLGRLGTPEDVAGVVTFLASEYAAYITGQTFNSDGGMVMQ
ncbi:MAG: 3-oxoacyl-ACP reductase FabG [Chloroflexi bacterium]|nr:3-oxoacyl-ACP reductase FabG [Chloroflexota bacterium]